MWRTHGAVPCFAPQQATCTCAHDPCAAPTGGQGLGQQQGRRRKCRHPAVALHPRHEPCLIPLHDALGMPHNGTPHCVDPVLQGAEAECPGSSSAVGQQLPQEAAALPPRRRAATSCWSSLSSPCTAGLPCPAHPRPHASLQRLPPRQLAPAHHHHTKHGASLCNHCLPLHPLPPSAPTAALCTHLLLLVAVRHKEHGGVGCADLKGVGLVDRVLSALDRQAAVHLDDAARLAVLQADEAGRQAGGTGQGRAVGGSCLLGPCLGWVGGSGAACQSPNSRAGSR